jgi:phage tail-like protein
MVIAKRHPYSQFNFVIHLGSGDAKAVHAGFQEVSGLELGAGTKVVARKAPAKRRIVKITGINKSTDVTLKRGVISAPDLNAWLDEIRKHPNARRDIVVTLQSEDPSKPAQTWKLRRARIIKHTSGPLNAKGTDVAMEELVLSYERIDLD